MESSPPEVSELIDVEFVCTAVRQQDRHWNIGQFLSDLDEYDSLYCDDPLLSALW